MIGYQKVSCIPSDEPATGFRPPAPGVIIVPEPQSMWHQRYSMSNHDYVKPGSMWVMEWAVVERSPNGSTLSRACWRKVKRLTETDAYVSKRRYDLGYDGRSTTVARVIEDA